MRSIPVFLSELSVLQAVKISVEQAFALDEEQHALAHWELCSHSSQAGKSSPGQS